MLHRVRGVGLLALLLLGPSVLGAQARPAMTPAGAVEEFMRAASDSNITRMSELFGTDKGSARSGAVKDYGKRMVIMQALLTGVQTRATGEVASSRKDQRIVTAEVSRGACRVNVPFTTVYHKRDGWLVRSFDLEQVTQVNQPCEGPGNS
ncbi:MAG TPA: hypothetical protein VFN90_08980 [Gemmatimonadales bacterium]|nr:hypothetical protein [Gemmatimonadales bacterium]